MNEPTLGPFEQLDKLIKECSASGRIESATKILTAISNLNSSLIIEDAQGKSIRRGSEEVVKELDAFAIRILKQL